MGIANKTSDRSRWKAHLRQRQERKRTNLRIAIIALCCLSTTTSGFTTMPTKRSRVGPSLSVGQKIKLRSTSKTQLNLLKGLVANVDDEIAAEEAAAAITPFEAAKNEFEQSGSILDALKAFSARSKERKIGDTETKFLLFRKRTYGNNQFFEQDKVSAPPLLDDLNQEPPTFIESLWAAPPFRTSVVIGSFFAFPYVAAVLKFFIKIDGGSEYDLISGQFAPGIGILYGTYIALTLEILYNRQRNVQENATMEASLLAQVTQNLLSLFRDPKDVRIAQEAAQIIADQVRTLVSRSRGSELLTLMRADPYARIMSIVDHYQRDTKDMPPQRESLVDCLRGEIPDLMEARAKRLSEEASTLPSTHFVVLGLLTVLNIIGFSTATLSICDENGQPPKEASIVFCGLTAISVLFFNFSKDLNNPFDGVYQIRRSSAFSHLLQIKYLISNQPYGPSIRFDQRGLEPSYDGINEKEDMKVKKRQQQVKEMKAMERGEKLFQPKIVVPMKKVKKTGSTKKIAEPKLMKATMKEESKDLQEAEVKKLKFQSKKEEPDAPDLEKPKGNEEKQKPDVEEKLKVEFKKETDGTSEPFKNVPDSNSKDLEKETEPESNIFSFNAAAAAAATTKPITPSTTHDDSKEVDDKKIKIEFNKKSRDGQNRVSKVVRGKKETKNSEGTMKAIQVPMTTFLPPLPMEKSPVDVSNELLSDLPMDFVAVPTSGKVENKEKKDAFSAMTPLADASSGRSTTTTTLNMVEMDRMVEDEALQEEDKCADMLQNVEYFRSMGGFHK